MASEAQKAVIGGAFLALLATSAQATEPPTPPPPPQPPPAGTWPPFSQPNMLKDADLTNLSAWSKSNNVTQQIIDGQSVFVCGDRPSNNDLSHFWQRPSQLVKGGQVIRMACIARVEELLDGVTYSNAGAFYGCDFRFPGDTRPGSDGIVLTANLQSTTIIGRDVLMQAAFRLPTHFPVKRGRFPFPEIETTMSEGTSGTSEGVNLGMWSDDKHSWLDAYLGKPVPEMQAYPHFSLWFNSYKKAIFDRVYWSVSDN